MTRIMKPLLFALLLSALFGMKAHAGITITAASCNASDVQNAFNAATSSTKTITIPSGTCHWTTQVTLTVPSGSTSLSVIGAGRCSGTPATSCNDATIIIDDDTTDSTSLLSLSSNSTFASMFRFSGISIKGGTGFSPKQNGIVAVGGNSHNVRLDNIHMDLTTYTNPASAYYIRFDSIDGVVDHSIFEGNSTAQGALDFWNSFYDGSNDQTGDHAWAAPTGFGTSDFMFVEDSTFNNVGVVGQEHSGSMTDCRAGKFVIRHNVLNRMGIMDHPTSGNGRGRGCRAREMYLNTMTGTDSAYDNNLVAAWITSGTALVWGNTAVETGFAKFFSLHSEREYNHYPSGWGYCGTAFGPSNFDQNSDIPTGWACLDQPGQGQSDLLVNDFPNVTNNATGCNQTQTCVWPRQKLEPIYEWMDSWACSSCGSNTGFVTFNEQYSPTVLHNNRDYYVWCNPASPSGCSSFNGTAGTGSGLLSARPSTCTPLVAYWATDQNTLYQCSATNTWSVYYTPYTYPHPLQGSGDPPGPPSNLIATPQ